MLKYINLFDIYIYICHSCYDISMHIDDKSVFMFNVFVHVYISFVYILFVNLWFE